MKMFQTEHKSVSQHFCIRNVGSRTPVVFIVTVISLTLVFSPYIRAVFSV